MAASHASAITHELTSAEKALAQSAAIAANAPSYDSALLGAVRAIQALRAQGVSLPENAS